MRAQRLTCRRDFVQQDAGDERASAETLIFGRERLRTDF
jgi:hypothetical protein